MPGPFANATMRLSALGTGACLLLGAVAAPLGAQDPAQVVPDAVTCTTCSLDVSAVVELGDRDGPNRPSLPARDYYLSSPAIRTSGPRGYIRPWPVLMRRSADTLSIVDIRASRLTTIRGGAIATTRLPFMFDDAAVLPDGRHVYNALSSEPDRIGHPLHVYDEASRRITRSFGGEGVRVDRSDRRQMVPRRRVAVAADGNIWAAHENRYRIDKWSPDGDRGSGYPFGIGTGAHPSRCPRCPPGRARRVLLVRRTQ